MVIECVGVDLGVLTAVGLSSEGLIATIRNDVVSIHPNAILKL